MRDRVFIVCGGPSLKNVPLGWLRKEDTIAVNYMGRYLPEPTYFLTADSGVIKNACASGWWDMPKKTRKIVVINQNEHPRWDSVAKYVPLFTEHVIPTRWDGNICLNGKDFATGKNTGFCALQYAVRLGYKRIYLLGIDMQIVDGDKYCYAEGGNASPYDVFYQHFKVGLQTLRSSDIRVFSCSKISRLNSHIRYVDYRKLVKRMPIFVTHYTKNTPYEKIVKNLIATLKKFKLDYDAEAIDTLGTWRANSNYCATQVRSMLDKHAPRSICRVDADATIESFPDFFIRGKFHPDCAAAIYRNSKLRPDGELMGGTLYFGNNDNSRKLVDYWLGLLSEKPHSRNPDMLKRALHKVKVNFAELPLSYVRIFDFHDMGEERVIVHHQASRRCKILVNRMGLKKA